jgi:hypothetical protein
VAENERDFKGVWIPKEIWLDKRLNALEKVILTEIDSLDNGERGCWASNKHIADFCQCSETKVSTSISKLVDLGYLCVQSFDGRQRILKSRLSNFERQAIKDCKADLQDLKESNTYNNTPNNTTNKKERKKEAAPGATSYDKILSEIENDNLRETYLDFIKMRKLLKSPLTDRALKSLIKKVNELEPNSTERQIKVLEQSILSSWKSVYALKEEKGAEPQKERSYDVDEFFELAVQRGAGRPTAADDESIRARAEALKQKLS